MKQQTHSRGCQAGRQQQARSTCWGVMSRGAESRTERRAFCLASCDSRAAGASAAAVRAAQSAAEPWQLLRVGSHTEGMASTYLCFPISSQAWQVL